MQHKQREVCEGIKPIVVIFHYHILYLLQCDGTIWLLTWIGTFLSVIYFVMWVFTHLDSCKEMGYRPAKCSAEDSGPAVKSPSPHPCLCWSTKEIWSLFGLFWELMFWTLMLTPLITAFVPGKAKWLLLRSIYNLCMWSKHFRKTSQILWCVGYSER